MTARDVIADSIIRAITNVPAISNAGRDEIIAGSPKPLTAIGIGLTEPASKHHIGHLLADSILAALKEAGIVCAPAEPTKVMISNGNDAIRQNIDFWDYDSGAGYSVETAAARDGYLAMIAAAQEEQA